MRKWFTVIKRNLKRMFKQKSSLAIHKIQICICQSLDPSLEPRVYLKHFLISYFVSGVFLVTSLVLCF